MFPGVQVLLALTLLLPGSQACPRSCNCYQANEVHCTFRSLLAIPAGLPAHTRRINLGFNSISRIQDGSLAGLKRLELLMLHSNDIHHLPDAAFGDMKSLQILKLSYNKLREIPSSKTFAGLTSLLRLYLDHNLLRHIHPRALLQLPSLRLLRLQGNRLHQLHPHSLCTLSLLNTYYFSTLRHLDLSNNSLTTLPRATLETAPLLETAALQDNPWSCDCRMNWFISWSLARRDVMKCPGSPQCPVCASPASLQAQGVLEQNELSCASPAIAVRPGEDAPSETDVGDVRSSDSFGEPLGTASLELSDLQGNHVDLSCDIHHLADSQDISPPPDLSLSSSAPIALALTLSLDCPVEGQSYEQLWRILAYYSETAVHLEREIMLGKLPALAYRYRQAEEAEGYYNTGVRASFQARPQWLLQSSIGVRLNRAQSNGQRVKLIYSTRVSAQPDPVAYHSASLAQPWVLISTNQTKSALAAVAGSTVELSCPVRSSGNAKVQWILPDGSKLISPSTSKDDRLQASASGFLLHRAKLSDAGLYYCVAQAGKDVDVLPLWLAVDESSVPPSGEAVGPSVTATAGQPVSLLCEASGSPAPHISWLLPDGNVAWRGSAVSRRFTVLSNGTLSLSQLSARDAGHYRCIAVNQYGSDSLSMQLEVTPRQAPSHQASFVREPQSASGRSTKIRAPLLQQAEEGSGDDVEVEGRTFVAQRKHSSPPRTLPKRRYPNGKPLRHGTMRGGASRRGGGPLISTEQRRNRFDNRFRVAPNKQRIDPQKWADLLAKIRQKTGLNNTIDTRTTPRPETGSSATEKERYREEDDTKTSPTARSETEGSTLDDTVVKEESPIPVPTRAGLQNGQTVRPTQTPAHADKHQETPVQIENVSETEINSKTQNDPVTSKKISSTNEIATEPVEGEEREPSPTSSRGRLQNPSQGLMPNSVPRLRPQSPWTSRRRIGPRRRVNRPKGRPLAPPRPLPDPVNPGSQSVTQDSSADHTNATSLVTTTLYPATLSMPSGHVTSWPNGVTTSPLSRALSTSPGIHTSKSDKLFNANTHAYATTHPVRTPATAEHTDSTAGAPTTTHADVEITHLQTLTETPRAPEKPGDRNQDKEFEDLESNLSGSPQTFYPLPATHSSMVTLTTTPISILEGRHYTSLRGVLGDASTAAGSYDTLPSTAVSTLMIPQPTTSTTSVANIRIHTSTTTSLPTTTTKTTTTILPTALASKVTSSYSASTAATSDILLFESTFTPINPTTSTVPETSAYIPNTSGTVSTQSLPSTTATIAQSTLSAKLTTTSSKGTVALSGETLSVGQVDSRGRLDAGTPLQTQGPTGWKNVGANLIPDSSGSRPRLPPGSSNPASPRSPVVRSRPKIADPHIRTVSFPAESVAQLHCEAKGEPEPSITWTKVATGAVISVHSRAQRLEVLPNGTLVIQNVQLQDRGTYICSAHSVLGRDRLMTALEVWTRPPRIQLASYREATIHQGGELNLECRAVGVPTPLLSWVLPDRSVLTSATNSGNRVTVDANGTLGISVTLPGDRGVYRCVASNSAGAASSSVRVHVSSLPPMIQQSKEEHLLLTPGEPVYAHCSARGAPTPTLRWRIPVGTIVRPSQFLHGNLFVLPNGTLHIRRVGPKDAGNYECTSTNAVGADKRTVRLEVWVEPKRERTVEGGVAGTLTPTSSPQKGLSNYSDSSLPVVPARFLPLSPPERHKTSSSGDSGSSSHPRQPTSAGSSSAYRSGSNQTVPSTTVRPKLPDGRHNGIASPGLVNNNRVTYPSPSDRGKASAVSHSSPVSTFNKARIVSTSPSITTVSYGGYLQLHCSVIGNPSPIIIWRTPNRKLADMHFSFDRRLKVHPNGTLSVLAATQADTGDYLCVARNKMGDDYRLLRVSVVGRPAKIEPKQPPNQMVSFGKPLKVDCLASGLPDPAVRWSLPDGTTVNSVLQGEERGGRARRLTVFGNGTLLVPAVGAGEEGEYTCYAENQGGQDTMKVKVKVMMDSPPTFTDDRNYHVVKVRQGETAIVPCRATGDPIPTVSWFSPARRLIQRKSAFTSERAAVAYDGTLEVRLVQKSDTGNYTCRASNAAGERSKLVGLEVEVPHHRSSQQAGRRSWSGTTRESDFGFSSALPGKLKSNGSGDFGYSDKESDAQNTFKTHPTEITKQLEGVSGVGINRAGNMGSAAEDIGKSSNVPDIKRGGGSNGNSHGPVRVGDFGRDPGSSNNEVTVPKPRMDPQSSRDNGKISVTSGNLGGFPSGITNYGVGTGVQTEHEAGQNSYTAERNVGANKATDATHNKVVGVVTTSKRRAVKGQTVHLPCPSRGSSQLTWLLPANGVLPSPYYGSRFTVHRNGTLEVRGLRVSDGGTLVCVVRGQRGETRIHVELEVSDAQDEAGPPFGGSLPQKPAPNLGSPSEVLPGSHHSRPVNDKNPLPPNQQGRSSLAAAYPLGPPPSNRLAPEPVLKTRTASLVSIVNGETLRLPCSVPEETLERAGSLSWTLPSGKVVSRGDSADFGRYLVQEDGTLTVQQVSVFDRGAFVCKSSTSDSSTVSVITVPVIVIAYPPRITAGPSPVTYTRPGVAVELPCLTIATPKATVTWETPDLTQLRVTGHARSYGNRFLSSQGSLVIQKPTSRDTGFYRCTAKNVIGVDTKATYLHVI